VIHDEVARTHPLALAARSREAPPWDIDNADNGIALPGSLDEVGASGLPVHRGSHRGYTKYATETLDTAVKALSTQYGALDQAHPEVLVQTMKDLEVVLREAVLRDPTLRDANGRLF
jgi:hypothetical protein